MVEGVLRVADVVPRPDDHWDGSKPDPATSAAPFRLYNIGNHTAVDLVQYIHLLEEYLGKRAHTQLLPPQPGDLSETCADVDDLARVIGFTPSTPLEVGVKKFVEWYMQYYGTGTREGIHS
ncbi:MAG: hypothetical protein C4326_07160 [Ignavibacteria bacterium]